MEAAISAADIATAGTAGVAVVNAGPGGGASGTLTLTINNPLPTMTSLSPASATTGGSAFTLTVNGTQFVSGSRVQWNGANRITTYVSSTQLTAAIGASDIAKGGTFPVTVSDPTPGGGTSGSKNFTVNNPPPVTTSLAPTSVTAGGSAFTLNVYGTGFVSNATIKWNGTALVTTYVSATRLYAAVPATDIATAGTPGVAVVNPAPGGGASGSLRFTINNPAPTLTTLSPTSATAGGAAFTLTVTGTNFVSGSKVQWNGANRTTTYVSSTQLTAAILATDIATAGTAPVTVANPTPGGGTSGSKTFTINNPMPTTTSLSPSSNNPGGTAFTLTVTGTNFVKGSIVKWNGAARTTTYASSTQLTAAITATDVAKDGTFPVTVFNPTPGGGTSNTQTFYVNNPVPVLTSLSPTSATAGGAAFTLDVYGSSFVSAAVVNWNGNALTTTYVSATHIQAAVPATDITTAGSASVTVFNPPTGGGTSGPQTFTINP